MEVADMEGNGRRQVLGKVRLSRVLLLVLLLVLSGITLFPPWTYTYSRAGMSPVLWPAPRGFIFHPPRPIEGFEHAGIILDIGRLAVEWLAVASCAGAVYALVSLKKETV